jgi:hypothetical protein
VAPGATRTYEYYADKELGLTLALNLGDADSIAIGGYGGVVVEPTGSTYRSPGTLLPLPGDGAGIQADIVKDGLAGREFVALFLDGESTISQDHMPYPDATIVTTAISYAAEPLSLRNFIADPANVFSSVLWGDPRNVVTVPQGASLTFRLGAVWAEMPHVATLEAHRYRQEPGMSGSEVIYGDVLSPGMSLNAAFLGGAGGDLQATGDYLFLDHSQLFLQGGLWNLVRVTDAAGGHLAANDNITITSAEVGRGKTILHGFVGTKPAGDTVGRLGVFNGAEAGGKCTGERIGVAQVDRGSGLWQFDLGAQAPQQLCLQSPGGGVVSAQSANPVAERTRRMLTSVVEAQRLQREQVRLQKEFAELERMQDEQ